MSFRHKFIIVGHSFYFRGGMLLGIPAVSEGQREQLSIQDSVQNSHLVGVDSFHKRFPTDDMPKS